MPSSDRVFCMKNPFVMIKIKVKIISLIEILSIQAEYVFCLYRINFFIFDTESISDIILQLNACGTL